MPITVELRGGPFDGQPTCVVDMYAEVVEVLGENAYVYTLGGFRAGRPVFFDLDHVESICQTDERL